MEACSNDEQVLNAISSPGGFGNKVDLQNMELVNEDIKRFSEDVKRVQKERLEDELTSAALTIDLPVIAPPNKTDAKMASIIAKRLNNFSTLANAGRQEKIEAYSDAMHNVSGTSNIIATAWMNFQNDMTKWLVNQRNDMRLFGDTHLHEEGKLGWQNQFNQAFDQMIPKIRGMAQKFADMHDTFMDGLTPLFRKTTISKKNLAEYGGFYLTCLHALERNPYLLNGWRDRINTNIARINELRSKGKISGKDLTDLKKLTKETTELTRQWNALRDNLDNENPPEGLVSAGYTNGEARAEMVRIERETGLTREELESIARPLSDMFHSITEELARAGAIAPEQIAAFPKFEWYAPMVTKKANLNIAINDATHYTPGSRQAMEGMRERPDSAYSTLHFAMRRAATEIGMQDFGLMFAAAERKFSRKKVMEPDWKSPILSFNDSQLNAILQHGSREQREIAQSIRDNNGMVVNVPVTDKDGRQVFDRRYLYFNPNFKEGRLTGQALNEALSSNYKLGAKPLEMLSTATSYYGQSFTRFSPPFAPVAGTRDFLERAFHIASSDYYTADGRHISGASLVGKFALNAPRVGKMLFDSMTGKAEEGSRAAQYGDEYRRMGLQQKFKHSVGQAPREIDELSSGGTLVNFLRSYGMTKSADWLQNKKLGVYRRILGEAGIAGKKALDKLDGWNDWWQNVSPFTHYVTLREAGMSAKDAAYNTRIIMDMSQSGSIAKYLAVVAPFVRPTMQGAGAFARSMGLSGRNMKEIFESGKKGWMTALAATAAFGVLYTIAKESLGEDENGNPRLDMFPVSRASNFIPIGIDDNGGYIKMPNGFGPVRVAATLSLCMDRLYRGLMTPSDAAFEVLFATARDTIPGNNPMFDFKEKPAEFIMHYFCPAPLKPFMELATNTNAFGGRIQKEGLSPEKPKFDQGFKNTPAVWHRVAREIYNTTGADLTPEAYRYMAKGLALGPLRMITSAIVSFSEKDEPRQGLHKPTALEELGPIPAALGATLLYGKLQDPSQHYYYRAVEELTDKAKRAGVSMTQDGKSGAEGEAIVRQKLEAGGISEPDIEDILLLRRARKKLLGIGSSFNKEHSRWWDEEDSVGIRQSLESIGIQSDDVYRETVRQLNYYK